MYTAAFVYALWLAIHPFIPGTAAFKWRAGRAIAKTAHTVIGKFTALQCLDAPAKGRVRPQVRRYAIELARVDFRTNFFLTPFLIAIFLAALFWMIFGPVYVYYVLIGQSATVTLPQPWAFDPNDPLLNAGGVGTVAAFCSLLVLLSCSAGRGYFYYLTFGFVVCAVILYRLLVASSATAIETSSAETLVSLIGAANFFFLSLCLGVGGVSLGRTIQWRRRALHPEAVVVCTLLDMLTILEDHPVEWIDTAHRQKLLSNIENTATCIQCNLYRNLRIKDRLLAYWVKERTGKIATAMRGLQKWVLAPNGNTRADLIKRLSAHLSHAAVGEWDLLEQAEPEKVSGKQFWWTRVIPTFRAVLSGAVLIVGFFYMQRTPLALQGPIAEYVKIGVFLWAALSVLSILDPKYDVKISGLKDIGQLLIPGKGKDKE
jgi:hypothetical protein